MQIKLVQSFLLPVSDFFVNKCFLGSFLIFFKAPDGHIFLETFSAVYKHAHDFLIAISEVRAFICKFEVKCDKLNFLWWHNECTLAVALAADLPV